MNVSFVGLGKLGLPCALAIESRGHTIVGTDVSSEVLKNILERKIPYYEEGAYELLQSSNIRIMDVEHLVQFADIIFIAVQTPHTPGYEGITPLTGTRADFDYTFLKTAFQEITEQIEKQGEDKVVIIISTVLPGTVRRELMPLITGTHTKICYNPFFIAMGSAVQDFLNPEFVLFGVEDNWAANKAKEFYRTIHTKPFVSMSVESAELTKVSYNTWISSKIGISNNIMEICHKIPGANVDDVINALKLATDRIVSTRYMDAGGEDGGACHPRDAIALSWLARKLDLSYDLYTDLMYARERRTQWFADMIIKEHLRTNHPIVILGQAFKPEVGMTTGSAGVLLKNVLNRRGYSILAYDPFIDNAPLYDEDAYVYFVATKHEVFKDYKFHPGSIVFDPFRYISEQEGVTLIPIGA